MLYARTLLRLRRHVVIVASVVTVIPAIVWHFREKRRIEASIARSGASRRQGRRLLTVAEELDATEYALWK